MEGANCEGPGKPSNNTAEQNQLKGIKTEYKVPGIISFTHGQVVDCFSFQSTNIYEHPSLHIYPKTVYMFFQLVPVRFGVSSLQFFLLKTPRSVRRCWLRCELAEDCVHSRSAKGEVSDSAIWQRGWIPKYLVKWQLANLSIKFVYFGMNLLMIYFFQPAMLVLL